MSSVPTAEVYLAPGFDPASLKVAQLRGILTEHLIPIPSTSKKSDLILLFRSHILIKAQDYRQRAGSVVASTDGIREVDEDGVEGSPQPIKPLPPKPTRKPRQSAKPTSTTATTPPLATLTTNNVDNVNRGVDGRVTDDPFEGGFVAQDTGVDLEAAARRRTRRVTRSQTPLDNPSMTGSTSIDGLPTGSFGSRPVALKPSFPSILDEAEEDEQVGPRGRQEDEVIVLEAPVERSRKKKSTSTTAAGKKGKKSEVGVEEVDQDDDGQVWEKTPSKSRSKPTSTQTTPLAQSSNANANTSRTITPTAAASRTYSTPNKYGVLDATPSSRQEEESGFSDWNPFQSGGDEAKGVSRRKRKTLGERKTSGLNTSVMEPEATPMDSPVRPAPTLPASSPLTSSLTSPTKQSSPIKKLVDFITPSTPVRPPSPIKRIVPDMAKARTTPEASRTRREATPQEPETSDSGVDVDVKVARHQEVETPVEVSNQVVRREKNTSERSSSATELIKRVTPGPLDARKTETTVKFSVLMAVLGFLVWAYQYQQQSAPLGYCDPNATSNSIIRSRETKLIKAAECVHDRHVRREKDALRDDQLTHCPNEHELPLLDFVPRAQSCTPCPSHAVCADGKVLGCQGDYILEPNPLLDWLNPALNGLPGLGPVAFPPSCELDVKTKAQIGEIAKKVEERLAVRKGEVVCAGRGPRGKEKRSEVERFGVSEDELYGHFVKMVKVTPDQFRVNLKAALKDLVVHKNIQHEQIAGKDVYSAVRAEMPASCRLRIAVTEQIVDHRNELGLGSAGLALLAYLRSFYKNKRKENAKVKKLVKTALSRLQDQQYTHYIDPVQAPEPFLRPNQLRDFVLDHIHNANTRQHLWAKVQPIIETNANVRVGEQEVQGDTWKIWEWIGVSKMDTQLSETIEGSLYPQLMS